MKGKLEISPDRLRFLNDQRIGKGRYVLYWMQQSQREHFNHALGYAVGRANEFALPLVVGFGLSGGFPEANLRH